MTVAAPHREPPHFARVVLAGLSGVIVVFLSLPVVVLMTPFWLISVATRKVAGLFEGRTVEWFQIIEPDAQLGWRLTPGIRESVRDSVGQPFSVSTDAEGWRGSTSVDEAEVVVIGDSFAFGHAVSDDRFFPALCDDLRVKALGAPGYSMVHMLLLTRLMAERLRDRHVIWFVYEGNDLDDSLKPEMGGYRVPFVRENGDGEWVLEDRHVSDERWRIPSPLHAHEALIEISLPTFHSARVREVVRYLLEEGRSACEAVNARFSVALVPDISELSRTRIADALSSHPNAQAYDPASPDRTMTELCGELGIEYLSLRQVLTSADYRRDDVHWNRQGHVRVARAISEHHTGNTARR